MSQDQLNADNKQTSSKGAALEIFYQLLFVGLFMQNRRTDSMQLKIGGFFLYSVLGLLGKGTALLYRACSKEEVTCEKLFADSLKERRWQYLTSFVLATVGWVTAMILTDGDLDSFKETSFWSYFAGLSFDVSIFFAASDIKKVKELMAAKPQPDAASREMTPHVTSVVSGGKQGSPHPELSDPDTEDSHGGMQAQEGSASQIPSAEAAAEDGKKKSSVNYAAAARAAAGMSELHAGEHVTRPY
jgi:hypothetical protein